MAYEQLEDIRSRKQEKVALFLTAHNMGGLLCCALPVYLGTLNFPPLIRGLLVLAAAILGIALTLDVNGLPGYERLFWRIRGWIRVRMERCSITPEQFRGGTAIYGERALPANGPIRVVRYVPRSAQRQHNAAVGRHIAAPASQSASATTPAHAARSRAVIESPAAGDTATNLVSAPAVVVSNSSPIPETSTTHVEVARHAHV